MEQELRREVWTLRRGEPVDADALALVGQATMLETYAGELEGADILAHCAGQHSAAKYAAWLAAEDAACCLLEVKGAPVGYAVVCPPDLPVAPEVGDVELKRIYLFHRFQGAGMGRALMQWAIEEARSRGAGRLLLGVYGHNEAALSFYARQGFERIGTRTFTVGSLVCDDFVLGLRV